MALSIKELSDYLSQSLGARKAQLDDMKQQFYEIAKLCEFIISTRWEKAEGLHPMDLDLKYEVLWYQKWPDLSKPVICPPQYQGQSGLIPLPVADLIQEYGGEHEEDISECERVIRSFEQLKVELKGDGFFLPGRSLHLFAKYYLEKDPENFDFEVSVLKAMGADGWYSPDRMYAPVWQKHKGGCENCTLAHVKHWRTKKNQKQLPIDDAMLAARPRYNCRHTLVT